MSIIYMSPQICAKNHYTKYFLLLSGIICFFSDFKEDLSINHNKSKVSIETNDSPVITNEVKIDTEVSLEIENNKKEANPYDYPEDF